MHQESHIRYLSRDSALLEKESARGLIISDPSFAIETIEMIGFDALIGHYKKHFVNPLSLKYRPETKFEDVFALFLLNQSLAGETVSHLTYFELKMRDIVANVFAENYGDKPKSYLDPKNYNAQSAKGEKELQRIIYALHSAAYGNASHDYLVLARRKYGDVPLRTAIRTFTLTQLSTFYSLLKPNVQRKIAGFYTGVSKEEFGQYLRNLILIRNLCAHPDNEELFSIRLLSDFPDSEVHERLGIKKAGAQYSCGKRDYFGVVIAFKRLLMPHEFGKYVERLKSIIDEYFRQSQSLSKNELERYMGFPANWLDAVLSI